MLTTLTYAELKGAAVQGHLINVTGAIRTDHMPEERSTDRIAPFDEGGLAVLVKKFEYEETDWEELYDTQEAILEAKIEAEAELALTTYRSPAKPFDWVRDNGIDLESDTIAEAYKLAYRDEGNAKAYLLPWMDDGICWTHLDHGARFFFTDLMNGCTFGVTGPTIAPIVFHSNVGSQDLRAEKTTEQFEYAVGVLARSMIRSKLEEGLRLLGKTGGYVSTLETNKTARNGYHLVGTQANVVGFTTGVAWEFWCQRYMLYGKSGGRSLATDIVTAKIWP